MLRKDCPNACERISSFLPPLHYWIEHAALLGLALAAQGHKVTLGYLPYADWQKPINRFDLRRQNVYAAPGAWPGRTVDGNRFVPEPARLLQTACRMTVMAAVRLVTHFDTQYTLQVEEADDKQRDLPPALGAQPWKRPALR